MVTGRASPEQILARMRVPDERGLFVLGCYERPATLYMQQVRALNLIYALNAAGRGATGSPAATSLVVIGGGAAGLTAAAAAAIHGWHVTVLEQNGGDVLALAGSDACKRWLHPHIYDWPAGGAEDPSTDLGVLDWHAAPADEVVEQLRRGWTSVERAHPDLETHLGVFEVAIEPLDGGYLVQWNGEGPRSAQRPSAHWGQRGGRRLRGRRAEIVVLAVGFGKEERTTEFPHVTSYWDSDNIDRPLDAAMQPPHVLISGSGDGGLIDALRFSFKGFKHEEILERLRSWLGDSFDDVKRRLAAIEEQAVTARAAGRAYLGQLNAAYRELVDALQPANPQAPPLPLREDVRVVLTDRSPLPLTLAAAPINRFLFSLTNAQYMPGPITRVEREGEGRNEQWKVWFRDEKDARPFAKVIVRHGPTPAIKRDFPAVHARCEELRTTVERKRDDPTRTRCYDEPFTVALKRALPPVPPQGGSTERDAALAHVDWTVARSAVLDAYRATVSEQAGSYQFMWAGQQSLLHSAGALERGIAHWLREGPSIRLIRGAPGVGKTALLHLLAADAAREPSLVPVYLACRAFRSLPDLPFFVAAIEGALVWAGESDREALRTALLQRMLQGQLVVLLDGLDEARPPDRARIIGSIEADAGNLVRGNRLVVTSRPGVDLPPALEHESLDFPSASRIDPTIVLEQSIELAGAASDPPMQIVLGELALLALPTTRFTIETAVESCDRARRAGLAISTEELLASRLLDSDGESYSFTDRLLQELLAGRALARHKGARELIALAFEEPYLDTQVVPFALAHAAGGDDSFAILESVPESIDFAVVRLRLCTARYRLRPSDAQASRLADAIERLVGSMEVASPGVLRRVGSACAGIAPAVVAVVTPRMAALLNTPDRTVVGRALVFLEHARLRGSMELIVPLLQAPDDDVREAAARALGELGDPAAIPALRTAYLTGHLRMTMVFSPGVEAIERIGGRAAVEALVEILENRGLYTNLRWPAAKHLGNLADAASLHALVDASRDPADAVRTRAATALGRFANDLARDALVALLDDADDSVRFAAATSLVAIARPAHASRLLTALSDSAPPVRDAAANALLRLDPDALLVRLQEIIRDERDSWRGNAVEAAADVLGREALALLLQLSTDRDGKLRWGAARGLAHQAHPDAARRLIELTDDPSSDVRHAAVESLGRRSEPDAAVALERRVLLEEREVVGFAAAQALGRIGGPIAVRALTEAVQRGSYIAAVASRWLAALAGDAAIPVLAAAWRAHGDTGLLRIREAMADAIASIDSEAAASMLRVLVASEDARWRTALVIALGEMTHASAVPALLLLMGDDDDQVRTRARWAVQALRMSQVRAGLVLALRDGHPVVARLAAEQWPFYEAPGRAA